MPLPTEGSPCLTYGEIPPGTLGEPERGWVPKVLLQGHTLFKEKCCSFAERSGYHTKPGDLQSRDWIAGLHVTGTLPGFCAHLPVTLLWVEPTQLQNMQVDLCTGGAAAALSL